MSTAIVPPEILPIQEALAVYRPPDEVLAEAHKAAAALKVVIDAKTKKVTFNGEQYLEFEDWQTLGRFYGITSVVRSTKYVEFGAVKGFEASADALLVATNQVVSSADAMCLNDEANWGTRAKYEWQDKIVDGKKVWNKSLFGGKGGYERERVKLGEEQVPLFQLRSMAQTRACAKALRNVLAWVVVLAGYKPTPAEELPIHEVPNEQPRPSEMADRHEEQHSHAMSEIGRWPTVVTMEGDSGMMRCYVIDVRDGRNGRGGTLTLEVRHMNRQGTEEVGNFTKFIKPDDALYEMVRSAKDHNCEFKVEKWTSGQKSGINIVGLLKAESPKGE